MVCFINPLSLLLGQLLRLSVIAGHGDGGQGDIG